MTHRPGTILTDGHGTARVLNARMARVEFPASEVTLMSLDGKPIGRSCNPATTAILPLAYLHSGWKRSEKRAKRRRVIGRKMKR